MALRNSGVSSFLQAVPPLEAHLVGAGAAGVLVAPLASLSATAAIAKVKSTADTAIIFEILIASSILRHAKALAEIYHGAFGRELRPESLS